MQNKIPLPFQVSDEELTPSYATQAASGADLKANILEPVILDPGCSILIPTGVKVAIPIGYEVQVRPRSGLALKNQVTVLNTPGTVDADYRGEIGVILINHGKISFTITPKMRIAQLVLTPVMQADFIAHETLSSTSRGEGGFGHTGTN